MTIVNGIRRWGKAVFLLLAAQIPATGGLTPRAALPAAETVPSPPAAKAANGGILSRERYAPSLPYEEWFAKVFAAGVKDDPRDPDLDATKARAYFTRSLFDALAQEKDVEAEKLTYASDGLKIRGFLVHPKGVSGPHPVILWCRGGNRDYGTVKLGDLLLMSNWARHGYVVLASNYRGSAGSEGRDEIGGDDVHDVEALIPLARSLPYADLDNVFLYGQSRGGMMVYRALADGIPVRAAVVNSGVSDLWAEMRSRPEMDEEYRATMPDYARERTHHFCRRSAVCWPEKIAKPVLILHGTADWRVPPVQALALAAKLQSAGRLYSLRIFEGGVHVDLTGDQAVLDAIILGYFDAHRLHPARAAAE
jgi:dipeptidyl aminopeptidase/acylaminoacyl peptidase